MSVELEKKIISNHRTLTPMGTQATVDNDIIVPDTQPDVKTVLQAEVLPMVCEKHVQKDYIILTGNMDYSIIYLSDEKDAPSGVKSISTRVPFTHQIEVAGVQNASFAAIKPDVVSVDFSAVNSRKINVKSVVDFESNIIISDDFEAVISAHAESELPCRNQQIETFALAGYCENEFELSDTFSIPSGSEMIDELLKVDVKVNSREVKSISGKPVAKGTVDVRALYTDTAGQIQCIEGEIPFTEILSVDDVGEDDMCEVEYTLTDLGYSAAADSDGDVAILELRTRINIATCVYRKNSDYITEDLYSPDFDVSVSRDNISVCRLVAGGSDRNLIKDTVQLSAGVPPISKIYNVIAKPYVESAEIKGGKAHISGVADTYIMYTSSAPESPVCSFKKEIPFAYSIPADCSEDARISVLCEVDGLSYNAISANAADVQFTINCDTKIIDREKITYISSVEAEEESSFERAHMPGIVIYFATKGERMWDIAKRYHTTADAIIAANGCDFPDVLSEPKQIMIPRRK